MKDTRSYEIKRIIKKEFPQAKVRVHINKYSMGESINVDTDICTRELVLDEFGRSTHPYTEQGKKNLDKLRELLHSYESVDRDQFGEILSGGNTYLFIE